MKSTITMSPVKLVRKSWFAAVLLLGCPGLWAGEKISEQSAVDQVKKTRASTIDSSLPSRTFGAWVQEKFRDWDIQWVLHDCGPTEDTPKSAKDTPVCVQVNIMQPSQEVHGDASNGFHVLFQVGTEKKGFWNAPRLRAAIRRDGDEVEHLSNLGEVEP